MKKLLTILILLLAVVTQGYATETTLWEGTYSDGVELNSEKVATFKAGDVLRVYATVPEGGANFKICYKGANNNWSETTIPSIETQWPWVNGGETYIDFTLTEADITALTGMNIYIYKGENSTITKVTHIKYFTLSTSATNGSITVKNGDAVTEATNFQDGTVLSLIPNPAEGYIFEKWTIGETESTDNPLSVTMSEDKTVTASFKDAKILDWNHEYSTGNTGLTDIRVNDRIKIVFTDESTLSSTDDIQIWQKDANWSGTQISSGTLTDKVYEFAVADEAMCTNIKEHGLYIKGQNATFKELQVVKYYAVTITAPTNGTITIKNGDNVVNSGDYVPVNTSLTLTATPADNYSFAKWTIGEAESTDNPHILTVTGDTSIAATFTTNPTVEPVFTDGKADLSKLESQNAEKVTVSVSDGKATVTTTEGWTGVQLTTTTADNVSGKELRITFAEAAKIKAYVKYSDETDKDSIMSEASTVLYLPIDDTKTVYQIQIQPTEAATLVISEIAVNAESTKPAEPVVTPVFTDGKADLSKLESQNAEKVTVSVADGKATVTTTEGWTGVQLTTTTADNVSGKELRITFAEAAKVKAYVKYSDETDKDSIMSEASTVLYLPIDDTKTVYQIQIQPTEATTLVISEIAVNAESTKPAEPVVTPVFTDGKADLSKLESQNAEKVTVSVADGKATVTTTAGWTGVQLTTTTADNVSGKELRITFAEAAKVKAYVKYSDETDKDSIMSEAATVLYMIIDGTKKVSQIQIQPTEAGSVTLSEVIVNAESTKPADPEPEPETPVFTDGVADLSKFEVQDTEKVTYDATTHTITVTEGWTGVQITATSADDVQGKELRITFSEAAKVKASVKYADDTATDSIMSDAAAILYMVIDGTKKVSQIQIQPIEAGSVTLSEVIVNAESTKPADPEPEPETPVFTDGVADLSKFEVQDTEKVTYDATTHTITVTEGWTGVQITATSADDVQGKELRITFSEAAKVKASVKYADDTATDSIMSDAAAILYMVIDGTKKVSQIQIQPIEAGSVTLSEVIVNAESTKPADPEPTPEETGVNISLTELNEGWNSTYDAATKTITTTGEWAARGWYVGDNRYNGKGSITVKFNAVDFPVTLKMEYTNTNDESRSVEAGAAAGETEVVLDIPANVKTIEKVYITYQPAGTLALTEATVNDKVVDNRTEKTLVENTQAIADGDIRINRGLFSNAVAGDIIRIYGIPGEGAKIALEPADYGGALDGANWTTFEESPFALKLTETVLNTIKEKGLLVRGENYTFTKAVLYTETALGNEIEDEEPEPEPQEPDEPTKTGIDISLGGMNEGWSSTYDASTKTITTEGEWGARGWYVGDNRYNGKGSITVKFNAVDFPVTLKMEYTNTNDESRSVEAGAAAGETEVVLDIPDNVKTIDKVYITYQPAGTLALTEATVNDKVVDNRTEKTLVENTQAIADGDVRINRGLFSNAVAGDIIRIYGIPGEGAKIALEPADYSGAFDAANWTTFEESPFALKLTETVLNTIKEKDLLVRGENYTFTKAVLYTEKELGKEIIDVKYFKLTLTTPENGTVTIKQGEDTVEPGEFEENTKLTLTATADDGYLFTKWLKNGEDAGTEATLAVKMTANVTITAVFDQKPVTIIDEETGEADLSKMTAQDAEATTVTVNSNDNSITITTTQPYKAAQIWFNEPEEVRGNVLVVNIAEQEVNVTVTVKYTDGTESSMTSTTAGAQRSAAHRASTAGTQITVPIDMGKKLQCIELKNALTGTLHVTKMVFTTQNVFTDGKANLSMAKAQSNATYDISTYTLATTKGWTGLTLTPLESEDVKGVELMVKFHDDAQVKLQVVYVDGTELSTIMDKSGRYVKMTLDKSKDIREVTIQPTTAGVIQLTELSVNQTPTPDEIPAPVFTNGKADLSRLTVQDASRVMYNTETYKMATTDGWVGVELNTTEAEYVSGAELAVRLTEAVKVKVAVVYNDGSHTDTIPEKATEETRLRLDATKGIQQIQIQPTEAGALQFVEIVVRQTVTPDPEPVYFFNKEGVADLSQLLPMGSNATYDETTHQLTTTEDWAGIQAWLENPQAVDGNVLSVKLAEENANVKISIGYTDGTESTADGADTNATETGTEILVPNDATKEIQKVMIQMPEAGTVTLLSISSINFSVTELTEGENRLLWKNSQGAKLSWNNICKKDALYGAILKEGQQLLVTVSNRDENNEWPKIFVRDASDQETGQVVELNSLRHYPYVVRITLTDEMVNQMADGFAICGDGVTVTSVYLYQPLPPQPGDINLIELNGGWNSTYDAERHIITTTSRWGACGWNIGDDRYNGMNLIQIGFEAVDFPVTLKMEYVDANGKKQATSAGIAVGRTTVELEIPEGIRQIDKVYLIWQQPGSVTLTSAEVSSTKAEALGIDLALFDPMGEKVSYDKQTYTMTTEEGYAGIQLWLGDANAIESPMLLELKTAGETAKLRVTVGYTDGTEASVDGEGANIQMELDDLRSIQKIMIQNMEAGTVTFNSLNITVRMPNGANAPAWNYIPVSGEGTYTVNGTKVSTLTKGLYIMDGKKIVIQ